MILVTEVNCSRSSDWTSVPTSSENNFSRFCTLAPICCAKSARAWVFAFLRATPILLDSPMVAE